MPARKRWFLLATPNVIPGRRPDVASGHAQGPPVHHHQRLAEPGNLGQRPPDTGTTLDARSAAVAASRPAWALAAAGRS